MKIDAQGLYYRDLNKQIREAVANGAERIELVNVNGQYFIGDGINRPITITVNGVPGNDLGAFLNGATIVVQDNGQDNIGNTMNAGKVIVHGHAGDVLILLGMFSDEPDKPKHGFRFGTGMHGGVIFVRGTVDEAKLSQEVGVFELTKEDQAELQEYLKDYCRDFKLDFKEVMKEQFVKILPKSTRPYGNMYCPMPR